MILGAGSVATGIAGISRIHTEAPDSLNELPALLILPDNGDAKWPRDPMLRDSTHRLKLQLFVQKGGSLQEAQKLLRPFVGPFFDAYDTHITMGGAVSAAGLTRYQFGVLTYAEVDYLGITFDLTAQVIEEFVYQP